MSRGDLRQQFRLDLRISNRGAIVTGCRNNLKQSVKRTVPNCLIGAARSRGVVLRQK